MNHKKFIDRWVIIYSSFILILIAINIPFITMESNTVKELYTEQEPYTTTETYFEKETYIENVPLNITATLKWHISDRLINDEFELIATLKNIDTVTGEFWVQFHVESTKGSFDFTTNRTVLKPGESHQINQKIDGVLSYVTYKINQPTQEIEKYRDISKERTVTGYRPIEKSRDVIQVKKNKLSLLQRILKYPPNYEPEPPLPKPMESISDEMEE